MFNNQYKNPLETIENVVATVVKDVVPQDENSPDKPSGLPPRQKSQIKADDKQRAAQIRQNISKINQEIQQIRQKKAQQVQQAQQAKQVEKNKDVQQKQNKKTVLENMIKSRQGSKENIQRVSG